MFLYNIIGHPINFNNKELIIFFPIFNSNICEEKPGNSIELRNSNGYYNGESSLISVSYDL